MVISICRTLCRRLLFTSISFPSRKRLWLLSITLYLRDCSKKGQKLFPGKVLADKIYFYRRAIAWMWNFRHSFYHYGPENFKLFPPINQPFEMILFRPHDICQLRTLIIASCCVSSVATLESVHIYLFFFSR